MKKYCALLLALLMLCFAAPLALAAGMYETYGDMDDWDNTTWELSDSWNEEQWMDYWQGEEEYHRLAQEQELKEARQGMDLPNPEGVNVKFNDTYITFSKSWPIFQEGAVYLPLREFLAACGIEAEITYNADTGVAQVILADGSQIIITLGAYDHLIINAEGESLPITGYDPPRLIEGVFYMEEWGLCNLLHLQSSWDRNLQILYVVDSEPLIEQINQQFSIYNRLFSISAFSRDMQQAYKVNGSLDITGTIYGDTKNDSARLILEYDGKMQGLNIDINMGLKMDFEQIKDTLLFDISDEDMLLLKALGSGQARIIFNSESGTIYMQSNLFTLADRRIGSKDWLMLQDTYTVYEISEMLNLAQGQFANLSIGRLIYNSAYEDSYYSYYGNKDIYANALIQAQMWQSLIGDEHFEQQNSGGYRVYSLKADQNKLKQLIEDSDFYWLGSDIFGSVFGYNGYYYGEEEALDISHTLSFKERNGKVEDLQAHISAQTKGYLPVTYTVTLNYQNHTTYFSFDMQGRYGGKLNFTVNQQLIPVLEGPAGEPPAGSKIITEDELNYPSLLWF